MVKQFRGKPIYTEEFVTRECYDLYRKLQRKTWICTLGELIEDKFYTLDRLSDWRREFPDNKVIQGTLKKIKNITEARIVGGSLDKSLHAGFAKFLLINRYNDWVDRKDITTKGEKINNVDAEAVADEILNKAKNDN